MGEVGPGMTNRTRTKSEEKLQSSNARVPHEKPPFTLSDLKKAVPPHCFERSLIRSFYHVFHDLAILSFLYYVAATYIPLLPQYYRVVAWPLYWICQGCVQLGILVIGHECGHHAFSDYQWVDDTVGFFLHSSQLIPFFSWKFSHRRHHSNTGSIESDEVFPPKYKYEMVWYAKYLSNPIGRFFTLVGALLVGWPMYLLFNANGRSYDRFASHYYPQSPIFNNRERLQILVSDVGIGLAYYILYRITVEKGFVWLVCVYGMPYLILNALLITITFLQHTHPTLPRYDVSEWDWLKGALSTVDRDFGILNKVFHNITDTHLVHHLFSTMSHYHAKEATNVLRPILGEYYRFDSTPFIVALWREVGKCIYVESDESSKTKGVFWYNNEL
ncbi:delta(12) acyl-lipid conjugase (11E,13E-forming)-like isoform X2 [Impatiens glandulifera]|uniref:delta(12) acyl-lipid conjugase (11E,13E-forming)-like isoform X2 n=1 Tax=Impatiens glandulifera TaxID=253017 RepID=UPI001FB08123|nr:delta(12) acyl-lipid conjugase (11E,13E-forming)-like isoform X2 [Impatiens glandulifera]